MNTRRRPQVPWSWAWGAIALAFPWSNAFMSVATGLLGLAILTRFDALVAPPPQDRAGQALYRVGWLLSALVGVSAVALLWGGDWTSGLHDVRVKLPLLAGGLAMVAMSGEAPEVRRQSGVWVLGLAVFSAATATASIVVLDLMDGGVDGGRQSARFISHIRFGLWWALLLPWALFHLSARWKWLAAASALVAWTWTQTLSGLAAGIVLLPWCWSLLSKAGRAEDGSVMWPTGSRVARLALGLSIVVLPVLAVMLWALPTRLPDVTGLPEQSPSGERYMHKPERHVTENGYHIWTCVAWGELNRAWGLRSQVPYETVQGALIRFLSSKGLCKDAAGVAALSDAEVQAVAAGVPSIVELEGNAWAKRWNRVAYNWGQWLDGRRSPDASILARTVYLQAGLLAWLELPPAQWLTGCGPGAVERHLEAVYAAHFPNWPKTAGKRPHNQYATLLLSLGWLGLGLFIWMLWQAWLHPPTRPGVLLLALSCLTEDTMETQAGVTLVVVALAWGAFIRSDGTT